MVLIGWCLLRGVEDANPMAEARVPPEWPTSRHSRRAVGLAPLYCPSKYSDRSEIMKDDPLSPASVVGAAIPVHRAEYPRLAVPDFGPAPAGEPRLATTA